MTMDRLTFANWLTSSQLVANDIEETVKQRTEPGRPLIMPSPATAPKPRKLPTGFFETESIAHMSMFAPGVTIVRQGDVADMFYIIVEGTVDVVREQADGGEIVVRQLGPGDYFGEVGLLTSGRRIASVRATSGVKVITFDQDSFREWLQKSPLSQDDVTNTAVRRQQDTGRVG
jgi:CRP-like cAMP-binding protein